MIASPFFPVTLTVARCGPRPPETAVQTPCRLKADLDLKLNFGTYFLCICHFCAAVGGATSSEGFLVSPSLYPRVAMFAWYIL